MGCSVKTGSTGSGGIENLKTISRSFSGNKGETTVRFSDLFPNITPKLVVLQSVSYSVSGSGTIYGEYGTVSVGVDSIAINISSGSVSGTAIAYY